MNRRDLLISVGGAALGSIGIGEAEEVLHRVAVISAGSPRSTPSQVAFEERMHELGYNEGHNLLILFHTAKGHSERFSQIAAEVVSKHPEVIVSVGPEANLKAMRAATGTVPIVFVAVDYDPVARGYVLNLSHPGGNITGVFAEQIELTAKRLELLSEMVPAARRIGVLSDEFAAGQLRAAEHAATRLGIALETMLLDDPPYEFGSAIMDLRHRDVGAVLVLTSPAFFRQREALSDSLLSIGMPASFGLREWVQVGGLMSYGAGLVDMRRRAADYVDKIIKGTKPADLPVEQPKNFELIINLKTAKALGLTVPQSIFARADEVIE